MEFTLFIGRISCITSLGYDHCSILGNTIEEIAANKCGIFHSFSTNFSSQQPIAASIPVVDRCSFDQSNKPVNFTEPDNLRGIKLGLSGPFQVENAALALAATRHFLQSESTGSDVDLRDFELEGLKNATWPGRSQIVDHVSNERNFKIFLDGAHTAGNHKNLSKLVYWRRHVLEHFRNHVRRSLYQFPNFGFHGHSTSVNSNV